MGEIQVGTASWTDKSLITSKRFYPRGCSSAEARLRYYAEHYPMVEVDSSYYAMPSLTNSEKWVERTPPASLSTSRRFGFSRDIRHRQNLYRRTSSTN